MHCAAKHRSTLHVQNIALHCTGGVGKGWGEGDRDGDGGGRKGWEGP